MLSAVLVSFSVSIFHGSLWKVKSQDQSMFSGMLGIAMSKLLQWPRLDPERQFIGAMPLGQVQGVRSTGHREIS